MDKFGKSQPVKRVEDTRFLKGTGRYVGDLAPAGALHAFFLRSPVAHAEITALDLEEARNAPGVHLVLCAQDLLDAGVKLGMDGHLVRNRDGSKGADPERPILAHGRVRFVGEAIAAVIAETPEQAKDAAELIGFDFDELDVHVEPRPGGAQIHPEAPDNIAFDWGLGDEDGTAAALAGAAHHLTYEIGDNRVIANAMEPRGCFAEFDGKRLHFCVNGQGVWGPKKDLAAHLGMRPDDIRVTNPDVGGGFGMKAFMYPEYFVTAHAARVLGKPVRWISDRTEAMLSDNAGRDLVTVCELGFDENHRLLAYRVRSTCNLGAYNSGFAQAIQTELFAKVLMGTYDVQDTYLHVQGVYTNTTQVDAYRGAGRPEAIYALERAMDYAAADLGEDPWALRRKNFIKPSAFPYTSSTGEIYDVGDFERVLDRVEAECDRAGFAARRAASEAAGKLRGLGLCYYIESILGDPQETARVDFEEDGTATIYVGTQSNGQGHETAFTRFLADHTGIPPEKINFVQGDSDRIAKGGGTGGSRSGTTQATATLGAVSKMIEAFTPFLAEAFDVPPEAISFDDEKFRAKGTNQTCTMLEAAEMARAAGRSDLLSHSATTELPGRSFPNGAHVAEVEVDPDTGLVQVVRYTVTDDFGNLLNPMIVEGQVHGGVAQGLGQALTEHVVYDETGQLLTATFMDYGMPRAQDVPMVGFTTEGVPSTANVLGMKGCGEAGTVGSMAAVANAVMDALRCAGVRRADMPFTPHRVWQMLNEEKGEIAAA
ncbi:Carbon monoxide dehydrogenase large chain [Pseudoruegeria aquimaris]|uniref:Carbon monoxide dehydrogenase large chain n=1 Tax=Pseudoruegeria aquimaris TaxID=393663 RepID=A0A1Y5TE34_9RHOB|nr:xanthine dehydrogenase family protein molybdopterin-binding subunit [Pseudoruegeria aquimaris]SLN61772.1 Carbon monoxide dehydrogenase large chain [Pseudoruegeria aquimaris]